MGVLRAVAPFICFAIATSFVDWRLAALIAAALGAVLPVVAKRSGQRWGELMVDGTGLVWFLLCAVVGYALPDVGLGRFVGAGGQIVLGLVMGSTIAMRRPFTLPMARRSAPPEVWEHPRFLAFNNRISGVWSASLVAAGLVLLALVLAGRSSYLVQVPIVVVGILVPTLYTRRAAADLGRRAQDPGFWD